MHGVSRWTFHAAASVGPELRRDDLSYEAMRLVRIVNRTQPHDTEAAGHLTLTAMTIRARWARTGSIRLELAPPAADAMDAAQFLGDTHLNHPPQVPELIAMKAAILHTFGEPLQIEDVPVPDPAPDEVQIQIEACGVCHSDLQIVRGEQPGFKSVTKGRLIPGHEVVGRVTKRCLASTI